MNPKIKVKPLMNEKNKTLNSLLKTGKKYGAKVLEVGSKMAEVAVHLKNPSPLVAFTVGAKLISVVNELRPGKVVQVQKTWKFVENFQVLNRWCFEFLKHKGVLEFIETHRGGDLYQCTINGNTVAWIKYAEPVPHGPWVEDQDCSTFLESMGRLVWEELGPQILLTYEDDDWRSERIEIVSDPLKHTMSSTYGKTFYEEEILPFKKQGKGRTILMHGESGVGKTHLMRYIAQLHGGFSLRIPVEKISKTSLSAVLQVFRPSSVLIDDLDRAREAVNLLAALEEIHGSNTLLMVSINDVTKIDHAILRPGRFDRYLHLTHLDNEVIEELLVKAKATPEASAVLRQMPIAYIDAYRECVEVLGDAKAIEYLKELRDRRETVLELAKMQSLNPDMNNLEENEKF